MCIAHWELLCSSTIPPLPIYSYLKILKILNRQYCNLIFIYLYILTISNFILQYCNLHFFPRVSFRHLPPSCSFLVLLDIMPLDNKRYRWIWVDSEWLYNPDIMTSRSWYHAVRQQEIRVNYSTNTIINNSITTFLTPIPCRYAYHRSSWLVAGKCDPAPPPRWDQV